jgi:hypothetical protein
VDSQARGGCIGHRGRNSFAKSRCAVLVNAWKRRGRSSEPLLVVVL